MNDLEFKQQLLDTKSASFCATKWYNATIWLGSGPDIWPHVEVKISEDQHGTVVSVLHWLCDMSRTDLESLYRNMLPDLHYNRERFLEFSQEQYHKMHHILPKNRHDRQK